MLLLRCLQIGLSVSELSLVTLGQVYDLMTEQANDSFEYPYLATDEDIDNL